MNEISNWIAEVDWAVVWGTIIAFLATNIGALFIFLLGWLKQRTKNFNYQKALETLKIDITTEQNEKLAQYQQELIAAIDGLQKDIIKNNDNHAQERLEALENLAKEAQQTANEAKEIDINSVIEGID